MTAEKERALVARYRNLFPSDKDMNDLSKYCLAFGFECGDGWYGILDRMMSKIASLNPKEFRFVQIKEKYGALRVYWGASGDEAEDFWEKVDAIIDEAELASAGTCEECGDEGRIIAIRGWFTSICTKCEEKRKVER